MRFKVENQEMQTFLVYNLTKEDIVDETYYKMARDKQIPGVLPMFLSAMEEKRCLKYNISSRIRLIDYLDGVVDREGFLTVFSGIVNVLKKCNDFELKEQYFLLDSQYIYLNVETKEIELLYLPLLHYIKISDVVAFLKNIIFQTQFAVSENTNYVANIMKYLDEEESFSIAVLKEIVDKIRVEETLTMFQDGHVKRNPMNFKYTSQPEPAQADWEGPIQKEYVQNKETFLLEEEKEALVNLFSVEKKKHSIRDLFISKKEKKQKNKEIANSSQKMQLDLAQEKESSSFLVKAYLNRVKTKEQIFINKQVLKIGKERSFVDYCILDNPTISRSHANIMIENNEYYIMDMNSKNHTYVNGRMIQSRDKVKLIHGSKIRLSNEEFEFYLEG